MRTDFKDVAAFHAKFDLPRHGTTPPASLSKDLLAFRGNFLLEELAEFFEASGAKMVAAQLKAIGRQVKEGSFVLMDDEVDLVEAGDALADLCYVALGTAHFMGLPYDDMWAEVQRANMAKERAKGDDDPRSKRRHASDVVKPFGWRPPVHAPLIETARREYGATVAATNGSSGSVPDDLDDVEEGGWA